MRWSPHICRCSRRPGRWGASDNLLIRTSRTGDGRTIATINGKVYNLLAGYEHNRAGGWFFLAVAGRTPLKKDDLAKHWDVVRAGDCRIAYAQRPFSYHLCQGDELPPPYGCEWPRFKTPPGYYAFAGPTEQALESQLCLALEQYRPKLELEAALEKAIRVPDTAGRGPDARGPRSLRPLCRYRG